MHKLNKILIYTVIVILLIAVVLFIYYLANSYKINNGGIEITRIKGEYKTSEPVIFSGFAKPNKDITVIFNNKIGITKSNYIGRWIVNLGKVAKGNYSIQLISNDSSDARSVATAYISVFKDSSYKKKNNFNIMTAALSFEQNIPDKLIMVKKQTPPVLEGSWKLLK